MQEREPETTGDYGYDLAHEAIPRGRSAPERAAQEPHRRAPADGRADRGQDYEYDEAHDF